MSEALLATVIFTSVFGLGGICMAVVALIIIGRRR